MRALTLQGLCLYLDCNTVYFTHFEKDCSDDFNKVITRIREVIYKQKFEGAAAGFLNANIIARDLKLTDKTEIDHTTGGESLNKKPDMSQLTDEEVRIMAAIQRKMNA